MGPPLDGLGFHTHIPMWLNLGLLGLRTLQVLGGPTIQARYCSMQCLTDLGSELKADSWNHCLCLCYWLFILSLEQILKTIWTGIRWAVPLDLCHFACGLLPANSLHWPLRTPSGMSSHDASQMTYYSVSELSAVLAEMLQTSIIAFISYLQLGNACASIPKHARL